MKKKNEIKVCSNRALWFSESSISNYCSLNTMLSLNLKYSNRNIIWTVQDKCIRESEQFDSLFSERKRRSSCQIRRPKKRLKNWESELEFHLSKGLKKKFFSLFESRLDSFLPLIFFSTVSILKFGCSYFLNFSTTIL